MKKLTLLLCAIPFATNAQKYLVAYARHGTNPYNTTLASIDTTAYGYEIPQLGHLQAADSWVFNYNWLEVLGFHTEHSNWEGASVYDDQYTPTFVTTNFTATKSYSYENSANSIPINTTTKRTYNSTNQPILLEITKTFGGVEMDIEWHYLYNASGKLIEMRRQKSINGVLAGDSTKIVYGYGSAPEPTTILRYEFQNSTPSLWSADTIEYDSQNRVIMHQTHTNGETNGPPSLRLEMAYTTQGAIDHMYCITPDWVARDDYYYSNGKKDSTLQYLNLNGGPWPTNPRCKYVYLYNTAGRLERENKYDSGGNLEYDHIEYLYDNEGYLIERFYDNLPPWTSPREHFYYSDEPIALGANEQENVFSIYPNPATDQLTIKADKAIQRVVITDVAGNLVRALGGVAEQLSIQELPTGVYFVYVTIEGQTTAQQFVKQ